MRRFNGVAEAKEVLRDFIEKVPVEGLLFGEKLAASVSWVLLCHYIQQLEDENAGLLAMMKGLEEELGGLSSSEGEGG